MEIKNVCRLCLSFNQNCIGIFSDDGVALNVLHILAKHFSIEVKNDDGLPQFICTACWETTNAFNLLYCKVEINLETVVAEFVKKENLVKECASIDVHASAVSSDQEQPEIFAEDLHVDHYSDVEPELTDNHPTTTVTSSKLKRTRRELSAEVECKAPERKSRRVKAIKELSSKIKNETDDPVDHIENAVDHHSDVEPEPTDSTTETAKPDPRFKREKRELSSESDDKTTVRKSKKAKATKEPISKIQVENVEEDDDQIENSSERDRQRKEQDSLIRDYFSMACEVCSYQFGTFLEARRHYRTVHQKAGYLACCNKRFFYRGGLIDHISVHLNPDTFKCNVCEKSYGNKFALADHMELKHLPQEDKQHTCHKCGKKFAKQYRLKQHIESHADEVAKRKRLICDTCGKTFRYKSSILIHIRDAHLRNFSKMCDVCAKTFNCEKSFKTHCLTHTEQPRMQCNVCGRWLKSKDSLRSHLRRHSDIEHACQLCNKLTPNRQALSNHILYVHGQRSHKCTLCNKAFKVALGLKEHMASHTGESLYTCPYCPKTFNSNGNMHKHRKNVHSDEWKKDRGKKMKDLTAPNF